jgi:hypothetical protein
MVQKLAEINLLTIFLPLDFDIQVAFVKMPSHFGRSDADLRTSVQKGQSFAGIGSACSTINHKDEWVNMLWVFHPFGWNDITKSKLINNFKTVL